MNVIDLNDIELIDFIGQQESQEILPFEALAERVVAHMSRGGLVGDRLPWSKTHAHVALGEGELSIWAGINGHGKSVLLTQVMAWLVLSKRVLIASLEMKPEETIFSMVSQSAGCVPSRQYIHNWTEHVSPNGFIYDCLGRTPQERILGLAHYAGSALNIDHLVIDSLTMCGVGRENYEAQAQFVNYLRCAAKKHQMHVHLVCHMRKRETETTPVGKFDIRGAGEIADLADKVFIVQRNKQREQHCALQEAGKDFDQKYIDQSGVYLRLVKNRQDGHEAVYGLYFNSESRQFTGQEGRTVAVY